MDAYDGYLPSKDDNDDSLFDEILSKYGVNRWGGHDRELDEYTQASIVIPYTELSYRLARYIPSIRARFASAGSFETNLPWMTWGNDPETDYDCMGGLFDEYQLLTTDACVVPSGFGCEVFLNLGVETRIRINYQLDIYSLLDDVTWIWICTKRKMIMITKDLEHPILILPPF